jgi:hypothetical protein
MFVLLIDAVNRRVHYVATSPTCCIRKGKPEKEQKKAQLSTSHNHGCKPNVKPK